MANYESGSLSLPGAIAMGTGVMIGAGIFALTGQVAELAGRWFPAAFLAAAIVSAFSAYSYVRMSTAYPSAGGIAMYLNKAYGRGLVTGACALLMVFSMIINESLVARTFGTYVLQAFDVDNTKLLVPALGVGLIAVAFVVNIATNKLISSISMITAALKIGGVVIFAGVVLVAAGFGFEPATVDSGTSSGGGLGGFVGAIALGILAYKGFTTITNDGDELENPEKNIGRAIIVSLAVCLAVYLIVAWAVGSTLSVEEISAAKDYALAEAARPAVGKYGTWFTIAIAVIATASGLLASVFAVSRMLAMITKMELIPHRHLGMKGHIQKHMLVYTCAIAAILTVFFDLSRIASIGAVFYLVMDIAVHWGVVRHLREDIDAKAWIPVTAIVLDVVVLIAFTWVKFQADPAVVGIAFGGVAVIFALEALFLRLHEYSDGDDPNYTSPAEQSGASESMS